MPHVAVQYWSSEDENAAEIVRSAYHTAGYGTNVQKVSAINSQEFGGITGHTLVVIGGQFANPVYEKYYNEGIIPDASSNVLAERIIELSNDFLSISPFAPERVVFIAGNTQQDTIQLAEQHASTISPTLPAQIGGGLQATGQAISTTGQAFAPGFGIGLPIALALGAILLLKLR